MPLPDLLPLFGSRAKAQEILLLLQETKPVVRQGFYPHEIQKIQQFCRKNDLHLVISKFKVLLEDGPERSPGSAQPNYSNRGLRIPEQDHRPGLYFVYFSKEEKKALLAAYYEQIGNDLDLGRSLGYPECCVDFFAQNFSEKNSDLQLLSTNPYTNLSKRKQDYVLLSHFPCKSECSESIMLAKKYLEVLMRVDSQWGNELFHNLSI
ncbi:MAG: DUF483 domain-containing protein [Nanoarchaeota archaeon]